MSRLQKKKKKCLRKANSGQQIYELKYRAKTICDCDEQIVHVYTEKTIREENENGTDIINY
jgi:hypothetical protein